MKNLSKFALIYVSLLAFISCEKEDNSPPSSTRSPLINTLIYSEEFIRQMDFINDQTGFLLNSDGIKKTNDGGVTWSQHVNLESKGIENALFMDFFTVNMGIVLTAAKQIDSKIFLTEDGGKTWNLILERADVLEARILNDSTIIGVAKERFHRSTTSGRTWKTIQMDVRFNENFLGGNSPRVDVNDENNLVIAGTDFIYMSTNAGESFSKINYPGDQIQHFDFFDANTGFVNSFNNTSKEFELHSTSNGGASWTESGLILNGNVEKYKLLSYNPLFTSANSVYASSREKVFYSGNGGKSFSVISIFDKKECEDLFVGQIIKTGQTSGFALDLVDIWEGEFCDIYLGNQSEIHRLEGL